MSALSWPQGGLLTKAKPSVFERWWNMHGEWVEEKNQRRGGESGVQLLAPLQPGKPPLYSKRQIGHLFHSLRHPFGLPTVLREEQALIACEQLGVLVPKRLFCAARKIAGQWQALLVTEELSGFVSLDDWYSEHAHKLEDAARQTVLHRMALVLRRLHSGKLQHGSLYSKHVYISLNTQQPAVALLDLEKSRRRLFRHKAMQHDLAQFYRRRGAMPQADWAWLLKYYHNPQLQPEVNVDAS
ncbi:MAG TPA: InaA protein [Pseudomonas sabulinigri]|uniref:Protein kinase domain-containing protein n=1 Tax=marine sediment metagenome TaxID=412755 RepID=A0A0F9U971_9ZZZZ|nr:InaA protein [Halopseudomonas sabulinigri]HEC52209.1 InaA protein [Halopseudomonas sabulinigri]